MKEYSDPPGWKSKADGKDSCLSVPGIKIHFQTKTGNLKFRFS